MSKKSKRQAAMKTQAATKAASERKGASVHPVAKKPVQTNHQPAKSGGARSFHYTPKPAGPDPKTVRIVSIVVAVLAIAGAAYWAYAMRGAMNIGIYVGLTVLGIVAGLAITFARKPEDMLVAVMRMVKR